MTKLIDLVAAFRPYEEELRAYKPEAHTCEIYRDLGKAVTSYSLRNNIREVFVETWLNTCPPTDYAIIMTCLAESRIKITPIS